MEKKALRKHNRNLLLFLVLIASDVLATFSLFGNRYIPTHDGEYHIVRFFEFYKMISQGYLFPRWAPTLNSGFGLPLFNFHYPFPNYVGSLFHFLGFGFVQSFFVTEAAGFLVASIFCFLWLRKIFDPFRALIGSILSSWVPYWFVTVYVRGSVGEVWALAFVFAVLWGIESSDDWTVAISQALLIVSHNIMAMIFTPVLLIYLLMRNPKRTIWLFAGIGISAYFWLPALAEAKYVIGLNTVNFRDHFAYLYELLIPSWGTEFSGTGSIGNKISFQIGIGALCLFVTAFFVFIRDGKRYLGKYVALFGLSVLLAVFLMLPVSRPVWEIVPFLANVQFPWRFLVYVIPAVAFFGAYVTQGKTTYIAVVIAIVSLVLALPYSRPVTYEPRTDTYYLSRDNFTSGTSSMGNSFSTIWASWERIPAPRRVTVVSGSAKVTGISDQYLDKRFVIDADVKSRLAVNILYFPGWQIMLNGTVIPVDFSRGIMEIVVPPGRQLIRVHFTETPIRRISDIISVISVISVVWFGIIRRRNMKVIKSKGQKV